MFDILIFFIFVTLVERLFWMSFLQNFILCVGNKCATYYNIVRVIQLCIILLCIVMNIIVTYNNISRPYMPDSNIIQSCVKKGFKIRLNELCLLMVFTHQLFRTTIPYTVFNLIVFNVFVLHILYSLKRIVFDKQPVIILYYYNDWWT